MEAFISSGVTKQELTKRRDVTEKGFRDAGLGSQESAVRVVLHARPLTQEIATPPVLGDQSESFCTVFRKGMSDSNRCLRGAVDLSNQAAYRALKAKFAQTKAVSRYLAACSRLESATESSSSKAWPASTARHPQGGEMRCSPEDVMKPDLFSEVVLLGSASFVLLSLLLIIATALTRA